MEAPAEVVAAVADAAEWTMTERWGHVEELLAVLIELGSVQRAEFLRANGSKSPPKPVQVRRPGVSKATTSPAQLFARMKGGSGG